MHIKVRFLFLWSTSPVSHCEIPAHWLQPPPYCSWTNLAATRQSRFWHYPSPLWLAPTLCLHQSMATRNACVFLTASLFFLSSANSKWLVSRGLSVWAGVVTSLIWGPYFTLRNRNSWQEHTLFATSSLMFFHEPHGEFPVGLSKFIMPTKFCASMLKVQYLRPELFRDSQLSLVKMDFLCSLPKSRIERQFDAYNWIQMLNWACR